MDPQVELVELNASLPGRRPPFAILDLETSGLDPERDEILQVAAVRVDGTRAWLWSSLVKPSRPVPPEILALTGLSAQALAEAPPAVVVRDAFSAFLHDLPVIGHNIGFDCAFLARWGLTPRRVLDTLDWVRIAFPRRPSHRLEDLADLAAPLPSAFPARAHDARADVGSCFGLLHSIRTRLIALARQDRALVALLMPEEWAFWDVGEEEDADVIPGAVWRPGTDVPPLPLPEPFDVGDGSPRRWFGPGGRLAEAHAGWEARPGQLKLAEAVDEALAERHGLASEAATGIGKSLAYLMPALVRAASQGERVVVATNTLALQDQLWQKDLPEALAALGHAVPVALMKGRSRYLCLLKTEEELLGPQAELREPEERVAWASLVVWLSETVDGERDDWSQSRFPAGGLIWDRMAADREACAGARCRYAGPCFLRQSRRQAEASLLVVTNHAQLLTHAGRQDVLPPFQHLVVDEAHRLPDVADQVMGLTLALGFHQRRLREWAGDHGPLAHAREPRLIAPARATQDRVALLARAMADLERATATALETYGRPASVRARGPALERFWDIAGEAWEQFRAEAQRTLDVGKELLAEARAVLAEEEWNEPAWLGVRRIAVQIEEMASQAETFLTEDPSWVDWWEVRGGERPEVTLRRAPLNPAELLRETLWEKVPGARVLLSATMTVGGRFEHFRSILGLPHDTRELLLSSPFDVEAQALLAIATDMPDPREPGHLLAAADVVFTLASATEGRTLVLTTSREATRTLDHLLRDRLAAVGISLLAQGRDGPPRRLARMLAEESATVLVGTASLWEGIDVPGAALTTVVVVRLPFGYIGDPLGEARRETLEAQGVSAFRRLTLPEAVVRFRQGFGRLLRTEGDFGAVVVLDPRIRPDRAGYGRVFVESLPGPGLRLMPRHELVREVISFVKARLPSLEGDEG